MPEWIHNRVEHLLAKNPSMPKGEAFALATQQGEALHKTPKGFGTPEGRREAKAKYSTPKDDKKTANPGGLEGVKMAEAFFDELTKIGLAERLARLMYTDIPGTPRLLMRERSPEELAAIQHGVTNRWQDAVAPIKEKATALAQKVPTNFGKSVAEHGMHTMIDNPEVLGGLAMPIPGVTEGYLFAKKGIEHLLDKTAPLRSDLRDPAAFRPQQAKNNVIPLHNADTVQELAKAAHYLTNQIGKKKTKNFDAEPPAQDMRIKEGNFPTTPTPMGTTGMNGAIKPPKMPAVPSMRMPSMTSKGPKTASASWAKIAFADSGFGPTGGVFRPRYESYQGRKEIPSPVRPDPVLNKESGNAGPKKLKTAGVPTTPQGRLTHSMQKGNPKVTGFAGPSVSSISKPVGYGMRLPGATKPI